MLLSGDVVKRSSFWDLGLLLFPDDLEVAFGFYAAVGHSLWQMVSVKLVTAWYHSEHQCAFTTPQSPGRWHVFRSSTGQQALLLSENASSNVKYNVHGDALESHAKLQLYACSLRWLGQSRFSEHFYRPAHLA